MNSSVLPLSHTCSAIFSNDRAPCRYSSIRRKALRNPLSSPDAPFQGYRNASSTSKCPCEGVITERFGPLSQCERPRLSRFRYL